MLRPLAVIPGIHFDGDSLVVSRNGAGSKTIVLIEMPNSLAPLLNGSSTCVVLSQSVLVHNHFFEAKLLSVHISHLGKFILPG